MDRHEPTSPAPAFNLQPPRSPLPQANVTDWAQLHEHVHRLGGSLLYSLSALSLICGLAKIIGPVLASEEALSRTLPCIAALNAYELLLLGVLLRIILWHNALRDAVTLVALVAVFLVASGITLATVANDAPATMLGVAILCLLLAAGKIFAMRHWLPLNMGYTILAGWLILLAWTFLAPALMAHAAQVRSAYAFQIWNAGWLVIILGGATLALPLPRWRKSSSPE